MPAGHREPADPDGARIVTDDLWHEPGDWWMFGLSVPWLSNQENARPGGDASRYFADQVLFLRTLASRAGEEQSDQIDEDGDRHWRIQLRYWSEGKGVKKLRCALFGAAKGRYGAEDLMSHLLGALPRSLPLEQLGPADARATLRLDTADLQAVEIRRAIRRGDPRATRRDARSPGQLAGKGTRPGVGVVRSAKFPDLGSAQGRENLENQVEVESNDDRKDLRVIPWIWSANALEATLYALAQRDTPTTLAIVLSPGRLTQGERNHLAIGSMHQDHHASRRDDPMAETLYKAYQGYRRELHEGCIEMHVFLAAAGGLGRWLPRLVGSDLSAGGGAVSGLCISEVAPIRTRNDRTLVADAIALGRHGGLPRAEAGAIVGLADKFPAWEANVAFRFPVLANDLFIADW